MKRFTPFRFDIPVTEITKLNGLTKVVNHGNIEIDGVTDMDREEPSIDFNSITWGGVNLLALLDNFSPASDMMQNIIDASHAYVIGLKADQLEYANELRD